MKYYYNRKRYNGTGFLGIKKYIDDFLKVKLLGRRTTHYESYSTNWCLIEFHDLEIREVLEDNLFEIEE